ncbi:cytochrome P450 [Armillaria nabsnona]|nr:cytochrome P450 [Armillaria nabsnona]
MFSSIRTLDISITLVGLIFAWHLFRRTRRSTAPFPPGPRGLPLLGNLLDMPSQKEWLTFAKWGEKYGEITSVSILGQMMVDRPLVAMGGELIGWKNALGLTSYGARFRNFRRLAHQFFGSNTTMKLFLPMVELEAHRLLKRVSAKPEELSAHIRNRARAIILQISYGYAIQEENYPFVKLAEETMDQFSLSTAPGGFLVNLIPICGADTTVASVYAFLKAMLLYPEVQAKAQAEIEAVIGNDRLPRFGDRERLPYVNALVHEVTRWHTVVPIGQYSIYIYFLTRILTTFWRYPEVQAKAQAEIDAVIGNDRLPRFDDRERLPYVNALVLEVTRWHTVAPIGFPHCVNEDVVQSGYFIPKGSMILANIWKMLHDPTAYNEPFKFNPDRFIRTETKEPELDPYKMVFGFGQFVLTDGRYIPVDRGRDAVFDISKYSENGVVFEPDTEHTAGTISFPTPFKCMIQARSRKALDLINKERFS